jgi:hypothetical protein
VTPCTLCSSDVPDNLLQCPCCGTYSGCPNVKLAHAEAAALNERANVARADAALRGAAGALTSLETALAGSLAVVNVDLEFLHQLLSSEKVLYGPYAKLLEAGVRTLAQPEHDQRRAGVEGTLFGTWGKELLYAALALDGRGLGSYGLISLELEEKMIAARASVLEHNSYVFVERQGIRAGGAFPAGFRSPWATRHEVGVAKLARCVDATTTDFAKLVLFSDGTDRNKDDFMEVHVYGTFNWRAIKRITVLGTPSDPAEAERLKLAKAKATSMSIDWRDP